MALPGICTIKDLELVTGLTPQRLGQLVTQGVIHKDNGVHGRYLTAKSLRGLLAFYKAGRGGSGKASSSGDLDPSQEKAKLDKLKQVEAGIRISKARGNLVESASVEALFADLVRVVVRNLETLPDRLERDTGLTGAQVQLVQDSIDAARDRLYVELKKAVANE